MNQNHTPSNSTPPLIHVWSLAGELALLIVIPLLIFMFIGIRLDRWLGTMPLFIILALLLSFAASIFMIARKIKRLPKI